MGYIYIHQFLPVPCVMCHMPRNIRAKVVATKAKGITTDVSLSLGSFKCMCFPWIAWNKACLCSNLSSPILLSINFVELLCCTRALICNLTVVALHWVCYTYKYKMSKNFTSLHKSHIYMYPPALLLSFKHHHIITINVSIWCLCNNTVILQQSSYSTKADAHTWMWWTKAPTNLKSGFWQKRIPPHLYSSNRFFFLYFTAHLCATDPHFQE